MTRFATPGTVIAGTLKPEDLIPALFEHLCDVAPLRSTLVAQVQPMVGLWNCDKANTELTQGCVDALIQALSECAPDGHYFGTHQGDGADFGYWPEESST
jgi:hypothetical protein